MTKKDYELIAKVMRLHTFEASEPIMNLILCLAGALKDDNPHFDLPRFLRACGVEIQANLCTCDAGGSAGCPIHDPVDGQGDFYEKKFL